MFTILYKSVGGRKFERYFLSWDNAKKEMDDEVNEFVEKYGMRIDCRHDHFNVAKGYYCYDVFGTLPNNEEVVLALVDGYFEDDDNPLEDKIYELLRYHRNLFHADVVYRALMNENISVDRFIAGYKKIVESERDGVDEYVPEEFGKD